MSDGKIKGNYESGNATQSGGMPSYPKATGAGMKSSGAKTPEKSDQPQDHRGGSSGRGIFNGSK